MSTRARAFASPPVLSSSTPVFATMPINWDDTPDAETVGEESIALMRELFPLPRSLTGNGVRQTLAALARDVPLEIIETRSGTQVFDWTVPDEWTLRRAWVEGPTGERVVDVGRLLSARSRIQHAGRCRARARAAPRARLHPRRGARLHPVPDVLLGGAMGDLHEPPKPRVARAGPVSSGHRLDAWPRARSPRAR